MIRIFCSVILLLVSIATAHADEYRPAYLEFKQTSENDFDMLWKVPAKGRGRLSLHVALAADVTMTSDVPGFFTGGRIHSALNGQSARRPRR